VRETMLCPVFCLQYPLRFTWRYSISVIGAFLPPGAIPIGGHGVGVSEVRRPLLVGGNAPGRWRAMGVSGPFQAPARK